MCVHVCLYSRLCVGLPRLARTVINPASLKGDSSLKPRSLGPPTTAVSSLTHTHTPAANRKQIPQLYLDMDPSFPSTVPFCRAVAAINKPSYVDITFSNTISEIQSFKPQLKMPGPVYGKQGFKVVQRILGQPVGTVGSAWDSLIIDGRKTHQPCTV